MKRAFLALAGVTAVALATAAAAGADPAGFRTSQPALLTPVKAGVSVEPIISVGDTLKNGYLFEAIPDGISRRRSRPGPRRRLREPRDVDRPVPVHAGHGRRVQRLHERDAQQPEDQRADARRARRVVRDPVRGELPALLLELPRHGGARVRARPALHERGGDGRRQSRRRRLAGAEPERLAARAGRRRRRLRREERRVQVDLRHGPAQPREQRRDPGLRPSGRALGRRHVHGAELAALPLHRRQRGRGLERHRHAVGVQVGRPDDQRLRRPHRRGPGLRPLHRGAARDRGRRPDRPRELVERERRLPVHPRRGHRLRPDDAERRLRRGHRRAPGSAGPGHGVHDPRPGHVPRART